MKKTTHEGRSHHAIRPRTSLILLIAAWAAGYPTPKALWANLDSGD